MNHIQCGQDPEPNVLSNQVHCDNFRLERDPKRPSCPRHTEPRQPESSLELDASSWESIPTVLERVQSVFQLCYLVLLHRRSDHLLVRTVQRTGPVCTLCTHAIVQASVSLFPYVQPLNL
jgi:hypothetical protein